MTDRIVTIGGPPGSGKSTAGRRVAAERNLEYVSAGALFRAEAERRGISLAALGELAEGDGSIDRSLDEEMLRQARPGRLLDGRVTGPLLRRRGIPAAYLVVTAEEAVRFERLAGRDGGRTSAVAAETRAREASERRRYARYYDIHLETEPADLTVDSTRLSPEAVVVQILTFLDRDTRGTT